MIRTNSKIPISKPTRSRFLFLSSPSIFRIEILNSNILKKIIKKARLRQSPPTHSTFLCFPQHICFIRTTQFVIYGEIPRRFFRHFFSRAFRLICCCFLPSSTPFFTDDPFKDLALWVLNVGTKQNSRRRNSTKKSNKKSITRFLFFFLNLFFLHTGHYIRIIFSITDRILSFKVVFAFPSLWNGFSGFGIVRWGAIRQRK